MLEVAGLASLRGVVLDRATIDFDGPLITVSPVSFKAKKAK
jgi:hypothetical protein